MRCRSAIAHWVYEKGLGENVIELVKREGETFVRINDYTKLRALFGEMLKDCTPTPSEL
jgi:dipeptidyl-peptidase-3